MANKSKRPTGAATPAGQKVERRWELSTTIIALLTALVIIASYILQPETEFVKATYVVRPGQTLWEIIVDVQKNGDVRTADEIRYEIKKQNKIGNFIYPGDEITVWMEVPVIEELEK